MVFFSPDIAQTNCRLFIKGEAKWLFHTPAFRTVFIYDCFEESSTSLTALSHSHRMWYRTGWAVTMNPSSCCKYFTGGIGVKVYGFPQKIRGKDHRRIVYLKKKEIFKNQKSGEKPQKLWERPIGVARNFANAVAKILTPVLSDGTNCFKDYNREVEYWS